MQVVVKGWRVAAVADPAHNYLIYMKKPREKNYINLLRGFKLELSIDRVKQIDA